jgi:hypothetical protein
MTTIAQAIAAASAGDIISIAPGEYNEAITTLAGAQYLTIRGSDPDNRPVVYPQAVEGVRPANVVYCTEANAAQYVLFENLIFRADACTSNCVKLQAVDTIIFRHCRFEGIGRQTIAGIGAQGLHISQGSQNVLVDSCDFEDCGNEDELATPSDDPLWAPGHSHGIYLQAADNVIVRDCALTDIGGCGIGTRSDSGALDTCHYLFERNTISWCGDRGILCQYAWQVVRNNIISDCPTGLEFRDTGTLWAYGNTLTGNINPITGAEIDNYYLYDNVT